VPFGLASGFASVAVPFVLSGRGLSMTTIATVSQVAQLPHVIKLIWSPALDAGWSRRTWFFGSVALAAASLAVTALIPPSPTDYAGPIPFLWIYTGALFTAQAAVATSGSAVLALMALTVPNARRGAASGWQTSGNLVGTAVGGALVTWMLTHTSPAAAAVTVATICVAAALPAALIHEEAPPRRRASLLIGQLLREVLRTLRSREGWTGMLICVSPVGAGALTNLFSALAKDYAQDGASAERLVLLVNGVLGGLVNAGGALLGGQVADRMNRRLAYVLFGAATAVCAVGMMLAPATPAAFAIGCLAYQLANGFCFATFYAFVLELLGHRDGVATQLALYIGASNFAISYVTWLDGWGYDRLKALLPHSATASKNGMLGMDALATFAGIGLLSAITWYLRRRSRVDASPP
jgi:PAT family beta-lactamase induction signal transducer AmpG